MEIWHYVRYHKEDVAIYTHYLRNFDLHIVLYNHRFIFNFIIHQPRLTEKMFLKIILLATICAADLIGFNRLGNNIGSYRIYRGDSVEPYRTENASLSSEEKVALLKMLNEGSGSVRRVRSPRRLSARQRNRQNQRKKLYYGKFRTFSE